ncbi:molecular chaperone TorD [Vibrio scophthalmi]|uniref:molecular chaperone TorD n=1 Tax=Vibrio scophthalmi TaxID=45658 RepID=UPI002FF13DC2
MPETPNAQISDPLSPAAKEQRAFDEQRAELYWWFSSVFAKELSEQELAQYHSVDTRTFLTGLAQTPDLNVAADRLIDALNRLQDRPDAQLELSADYCDLFLKSDRDGALPYASVYLDESGLLNGEPAKQMDTLLQQHGVAVHSRLNEPSDHLAIELDFLGNLIVRGAHAAERAASDTHLAYQEQADFIEQHLLPWIERFAERCQRLDTFGFYAALSSLLCAFIQLDKAYLQGDSD